MVKNCDLHVHLYGCLSASDVWLLGRRVSRSKRENLKQYAQHYQFSWGRSIKWERYWRDKNGYQALKDDYNLLYKGSFSKFQACFNLIIALFPIDPKDSKIPHYILFKLSKQNLTYVEPRIVFPERFSAEDIMSYLTTLSKVADLFYRKNSLRVCFVVSLSRKEELYNFQYNMTIKWLEKYPKYRKFVTGIDFASSEEGFPPKEKKAFLQKVLSTNKKKPQTALAIMYHVGESFSEMSMMSACRWVWQVHSYGVHRLSHCIALGVDPNLMLGKIVDESVVERIEHLYWLIKNKEWLKLSGYMFCQEGLWDELFVLNKTKSKTIRITYTHSLVKDIRKLQDAVLKFLKKEQAIIEVCPISNYRIGMMFEYSQHSLLRFIKHGINICLGSDDPGIFDFDRQDESTFCKNNLKISSSCLDDIYCSQITYRSEALSGRYSI